jgi:hypothetical protein
MAGQGFGSRRRQELEMVWRRHLEEALQIYRSATAEYERRLIGQPDGLAPEPGSPLARARRAQSEALREYARVLHIFSDLVIRGKPPDETQ